jgi:hypothetical protein
LSNHALQEYIVVRWSVATSGLTTESLENRAKYVLVFHR